MTRKANHCGAFVQLKSINEGTDERLVLKCTPIALGVAFGKQWSKKNLAVPASISGSCIPFHNRSRIVSPQGG